MHLIVGHTFLSKFYQVPADKILSFSYVQCIHYYII